MRKATRWCAQSVALALLFWGMSTSAAAQSRVSDKDVEVMMKNLQDDAKSFHSRFEDAIKKSTIRKTTREKDAKNLYKKFQQQTQDMLENFKRTKKGDDVPAVVATGDQINDLINEIHLDPTTTAAWAKIRTELSQVASAVGVPAPSGSQAAGGGQAAQACDQALGAERARALVSECLQVSPATHPPCNAANPCDLITDEIKRGCGMLTANAPSFCGEYSQAR